MSCKKPEVARGLRRMKTETDKEIVAINEANRRTKLRAMKEVPLKVGNCSRLKKWKERKEGEKRDAQLLKVVKPVGGKKVKKAYTVSTRPSAFKTL